MTRRLIQASFWALWLGLAPLLLPSGHDAAQAAETQAYNATVSQLPAFVSAGIWSADVVDGNAADDCTVGGGATRVPCYYNGSVWQVRETEGSGVTGWPTDATSKEITWANTFAAAAKIGNGTDRFAIWADPSDGLSFECVIAGVRNDCDYFRKLNAGKIQGIKDRDGVSRWAVTENQGSTQLTAGLINVETSGVTVTTVSKAPLKFAGCTGSTGTVLWDTLAANAPTADCSAGSTETTMMRGMVVFPDSDGDYSIQDAYFWPEDYTGTVDLTFYWKAAATSGNVVFQAATACRGDAEVDDVAWNTANTVTEAVKGTTLQLNSATISNLTMTGCAPGEVFRLKVFRNRTHASDTITGTVMLGPVGQLTFRRAQ